MAEAELPRQEEQAPPTEMQPMTAEEAAEIMGQWDDNQPDEAEAPQEQPEPRREAKAPVEEPEEESEQPESGEEEPADETEEDVASDEDQPSDETEQEADDSEDEDLPPIDPPSTLNKEQRARFKELPREVQERWADLEDTSSRELRRLQTRTDEERRAAEAERQQFAEARQRYETALPQMLQALHSEFAEKFPEIRTEADVQRLAAQNPNRYIQYDALMKKYQRYNSDQTESLQRQREQAKSNFSRYVSEQNEKFIEQNPKWADADAAPKLQKMAVNLLEDIGYSQDEIRDLWANGQPLSARDYRFQTLIARLVDVESQLKSAKANVSKAKAKPKQPVNKPGNQSSSPRQDATSERLKALKEKADKSGRVEDMVAYMNALDSEAA